MGTLSMACKGYRENNSQLKRWRGLALLLVLLAGPIAWGQGSAADNLTYRFDIPAQPLVQALWDFTAVTGHQVVPPTGDVSRYTSAGVSGILTAEQALTRLAEDIGLRVSQSTSGAFLLEEDELMMVDVAEARGFRRCQDHTFQVNLSPDDTTVYNVVGTLCSKGSPEGKTVQLLLSGGTYSRIYWDFTFQPRRYSYVRAATKRGYVTLNLERIGVGESDRPDGYLVDVESNAYVAHQVVQALRNGDVGGVAFDKVIAVGHSLGSLISVDLAANYPGDVDGLILTGFLHNLNPDFLDIAPNSYYPATFDPRFLDQFPNFDYFTTIPGTRESLFYHPPTSRSRVIAVDEDTKETVSIGEFAFTLPFAETLQIDVPVMILVGEFDAVFCGGAVDCSSASEVEAYEADFFVPEACLQTKVVKRTGHGLNLHINARATFARMIHWANQKVGNGVNPPSQPCNG